MQPVASKVVASTLGAAVGILLTWLLGFVVPVPDAVQGAIVTVVTFALGWLVPETRYNTNP